MNNILQCSSKRFYIKKISDKDYKTIHTLCVADNFYKYAKSTNYFSRDINKGNLFNFTANDLDSHTFIGQIKGYFPIAGNNLWIQTLLVSKDYLRQGYGTEIFGNTMEIFSSRSIINKIYLTCFKENTVGIYFWEKLGFKKAKELIDNNNKPNNVILYEKEWY